VTLWQDLREEGQPPELPPADAAEPVEPEPGPESYPQLTPAGVEPPHPSRPWEQRRD